MLKTLKAKLVASFIVINLLIIGSSGYNYTKVEQTSESFNDYRNMARVSVEGGAITSNLLTMRMSVKDYLLEDTEETLQSFNQAYDKTLKAIEQALSIAEEEGQKTTLNKLSGEVKDYRTHFESVQALVKKRHAIVEEILDTNGRVMEQDLTAVMRTSAKNMIYEVQELAAENLRSLLLARLYTAKFIKSNLDEDMQRTLSEFSDLSMSILELQNNVVSDAGKAKLDGLQIAIAQYKKGVVDLNETIKQRNQIIETQLNVIGRNIAQEVIAIQELSKQKQDTLGPQIREDNQAILTTLLMISAIIILFGLLVAFVIPRIINNGISSIQETLRQIGQTGRFDIRADDKRQDEIGDMATVLNRTLSEIQHALEEANNVVLALSAGDFSKRIEVNVNGDLQKLKVGVNGSVESIEVTMKEIDNVLEAMGNGYFNVEVNAKVQGQFKVIMDNTSHTMKVLNLIISDISEAMHKMQAGNFTARVNANAKGQLLELKDNVNTSMTNLEKAIEDITAIVVAQSQGDLTNSITNPYQGQLDTLKQAINSSVSRLSEVVAQVLNVTHIVAGAADEVAKGSMDLSDRVQQQASALEETSATMDEMNSAVQGNSKNAQQASHVALEVKSRADEGAKVMQETIGAMNAIQESSHKISDIVNLIDGIAFQTNLLALNAAVEAARAGEHGRGFAVVAGEVRSLAQKSAEAAKDIKNLIEESVKRIDEGSQLATQSGEMLSQMNTEIESFSKMILDIAQASEEQAQGVNQVHSAIGQIDSVTQQNAALVEETSAAAASMTEQADILRKDMSFFRIKGQAQTGYQKAPLNKRVESSAMPVNQPKKPVLTAPKSMDNPASKPVSKPTVEHVKTYKSEVKLDHNDESQWDEF